MQVLKAPQAQVLNALQSVAGIVERRHALPILANVLLRKHGGMIQLITSDLEIQIRTTAELGGDPSDFAITVGARKLIDILRTMPSDQIVSLDMSQNRLVLKGGKSKFTLQTLPAEDFPLVQEAAAFGPPRQPRIGMAAWNLVGYFETRTIDLRIEVRSYTVGDGRKTRCVRNRPAANVSIRAGLRS